MKLENQVTSLELSKLLQELGVKQKSLFIWALNYDNETVLPVLYQTKYGCYAQDGSMVNLNNIKVLKWYSAFTVAELGEMLPVRDYLSEGIVKDKEDLASWSTFKSDGKWHCHLTWRYSRDKVEAIKADTEADARAKMLIYLLENNLITL